MPRFLLCFLLLTALCGRPIFAQDAAPPDVQAQTYQIAPGDVLDITVQGFDAFHTVATVSPDGVINVIGVSGPVRAAGQTVDQLTATVTKGLLGQVRRPLVTVVLRETHPRRISVLGAVRTPGVYDWRPGLRLLEALGLAGGLSQVPELAQAVLVTHSGAQQTPLDMVKLVTDGDREQNVALLPGDILLVSLRDPATAYVQVTGQVNRPGPCTVPPGGATLVSVLNQAGSYTGAAALTQVQIVHDGKTRTRNLHPLLFRIDDPVGQERVVAGDVVNVPLNNAHFDIFGEVRNPNRFGLPDGEPLTVLGALAQAGGPTEVAERSKIGVVRDVQGRKLYYVVNADILLKGKAGAEDLVLQPGDRVVVAKRRAGLNGFQAVQSTVGALFGVRTLGRL